MRTGVVAVAVPAVVGDVGGRGDDGGSAILTECYSRHCCSSNQYGGGEKRRKEQAARARLWASRQKA
jgi:hypothetical protein